MMAYKDFSIEEATSSDINTYLMNQMVIVCTSSTRPSSPVTGMHIWETDTLFQMVYDSSSWHVLRRPVLFVRKLGNEVVTNSATLQDDDELFLNVASNATYLMVLRLITQYSGLPGPNPDLRMSWSGPSGATLTWSTQSPHTAESDSNDSKRSFNQLNSMTDVPDIGMYNFPQVYNVIGLLRTSGTSGTLQLRWAQASADAVGSFILGDSFLRLERVA